MLRDGRAVQDNGLIEADICIVGSGPAGLTVAGSLLGSGSTVVVLESGGEEPDPDIQALARSEVVGDPLLDTSMVRHRRIGGNANAWVVKLADGRIGVRHATLEAHDLERRAWIPESGWPFGLDELQPYYGVAAATCGLGSAEFEASRWTAAGRERWPLDPDVVTSRVFQLGPRAAFTDVLRASVQGDARTTLVHHATAVELEVDDAGGRVESVVCRQLDGRQFTVRAKRFVLALGGLENARLLLMSNRRLPNGVGNGNDLVGRFLQDHPLVHGGSLTVADPSVWHRSTFYDTRLIDGMSVLGHLSLARQAQERHGLLGMSASFFPRPSARRSAAFEAMKAIVERRPAGLPRRDLVRLAARFMSGADFLPIALARKLRWQQSLYPGFGRGGWSSMPGLERKFTRFEIVHQAEQTPEFSNRVTLGRDLDAVGCPKLRVEWRFSRSDSEAAGRARSVMADALARGGIGSVEIPDDDGLPEFGHAAGTAHHIGTTRMHRDPRHGVADSNGRLHEVGNVYVTGSSLFPTGGYANPTLTITALAHRLADHLRNG